MDERLVGRKPSTLSFAEAAALPLTALTAWELLFDRLRLTQNDAAERRTLLVINGAAGVGSILLQLARQLTSLQLIATASRPESSEWAKRMGAHHIVSHHGSMDESIRSLGIDHVELVAGLTGTSSQMASIASIIAPQGHLAVLDDGELDIAPLKLKSVTVSWEMVFRAATEALQYTPQAVGKHLRELEAHPGACLLGSTARRQCLTCVGADFSLDQSILEHFKQVEALAGTIASPNLIFKYIRRSKILLLPSICR